MTKSKTHTRQVAEEFMKELQAELIYADSVSITDESNIIVNGLRDSIINNYDTIGSELISICDRNNLSPDEIIITVEPNKSVVELRQESDIHGPVEAVDITRENGQYSLTYHITH